MKSNPLTRTRMRDAIQVAPADLQAGEDRSIRE